MGTIGKAGVLAFALSALSVSAYAADATRGGVQSDQPAAGGATGSSTGSADRSSWGSFTDVDKNGDGFVDQSEAAAVPGLSFMNYDADGDQRLSRQEYEAARSGGPSLKGEGSGGSPITPSGSEKSPQKGSGGYPER
ncbi:hypothetical protein SVA_2310 [Sulfurifustis variabilis]|uniref:EF-hand domain-containing protein n=1 Tax=Sulfurifustis variabilis TaxID=1675686 RepID=A0A1B4V5P3_9GAMM|nr:hypothetical protein [Sulfurifustis variabilis]BAU48860.1 hypothetical protein SVA_2310 [Sulfurifustis variabilis]